MPTIRFAYGAGHVEKEISESRHLAELVSQMHHYVPEHSQEELVRRALQNPIGSPSLGELSSGKKNIVIIDSDHTRPVNSKIILPPMLEEIRAASPDAEITILISTGTHRATTHEELVAKFGADIVRDETIVIHDSDNSPMVHVGTLPSGGKVILNQVAVEAELVIGVGFIEPHFFAGYSGGRKSVFPGITDRRSVAYNHNAEFISHPNARAGILDGNPIHIDMLHAARLCKLAFICNVIVNAEKEIVHAVAGHMEEAHLAGVEFLKDRCKAEAVPADIAITTNGGYPLDQNLYQAVKGMTAAEATVRKGGVIIMMARTNDGHGGESMYKTFNEEKSLEKLMESFLNTPKEETLIDQWQSQILTRILLHAHVVYVSEAPDDLVENFQMIPAKTLDEALEIAEDLLKNPEASITSIPDGVSVMVVR